ncbi:hypothetical protein CY652_07205 [Burkholderia sp. WAC0059]|nr:hypothetical protein CY652_07205 [Burkholderia sp. WAC0059]
MVTQQRVGQCRQAFGNTGLVGKQSGWFARFHSGEACTRRRTRNTRSMLAVQIIRANCYLLYQPRIGQ